MEERNLALVFVDNGEGRARDAVGAFKSARHAAHKGGLARAEVAVERDDIAGPEAGGELFAEGLGFRFGMSDVFHDAPP